MNEDITYQVLQSCLDAGAQEFIVCAGSRNSSFVEALRLEGRLLAYYWPEERSASFFALGRIKLSGRPVAVITTSGTAAAELFPAAMEAFYSGIPLILITADRPEVFRGSGAPQSAEQVGLFGHYVQFCLDISPATPCCLKKWLKKGPVHLNVCLEEPQKQPKFKGRDLKLPGRNEGSKITDFSDAKEKLNQFFENVERPIAIVSTLKEEVREAVVQFLLALEIPLMLEGVSGLREEPRLQHLCIQRTERLLEAAREANYPVDGVLRIGGVPTHRIWRDLEYVDGKIKVCVLSEQPFSGLSWTRCVAEAPLEALLHTYHPLKKFNPGRARPWLAKEREFKERLFDLFEQEKEAEPSLMHALSKTIPCKARVYLGNSLPIREWDMAAVREDKQWMVNANRGVNGIDGQISTFLGLCCDERDNWGVFGDLTTLYDMAGFWILPSLGEISAKFVIINNGGGKIFERLYPYKEMLNEHQLSFRPLAELWNLDYVCLNHFQEPYPRSRRQMIEVIPDPAATQRFWLKYKALDDYMPNASDSVPSLNLETAATN